MNDKQDRDLTPAIRPEGMAPATAQSPMLVLRDQAPSMRDLLKVFFKRKWTIILFFLAVTVPVGLLNFELEPVFSSEAKVLVERVESDEKALLLGLLDRRADKDWVNAEIEIIYSYPVAERVVRRLSLDQDPERPLPQTPEERNRRFERAVGKFWGNLRVRRAEDSNILRIKYESSEPEETAAVVNAVIDVYIDYREEIDDNARQYAFLEEQSRQAEVRLKDLEQRQLQMKQNNLSLTPDQHIGIQLNQLSQIEAGLAGVQTRRIAQQARLDEIQRQLSEGTDLGLSLAEDKPRLDYISRLKAELLTLEMQRTQLAQVYAEGYEDIANLDRQMTALQDQIRSEKEALLAGEIARLRVLKAEEVAFQGQIANVKAQMDGLADKEYEYSQLDRGIDHNTQVYSMLLKQREEARIALAKRERGISVKVVSPASTPSNPDSHKGVKQILIGLVLGVLGGIGLALVREHFDQSFDDPAALDQALGVPVFGALRQFPRRLPVRRMPAVQMSGPLASNLSAKPRFKIHNRALSILLYILVALVGLSAVGGALLYWGPTFSSQPVDTEIEEEVTEVSKRPLRPVDQVESTLAARP